MKQIFQSVCLVLLAISGQCLDKIGNVMNAEGGLKAVGADQNERSLTNNSEIFVGDTLITDQNARGKVKFSDGTTVMLIPGTEYHVSDYSNGDTKNSYFASLLQGGIEIATGLIAKKNPENFVVGTPNATIGVRGTVFGARVYNGDVFVGASSGKINVKNNAGNLDLGSGSKNQYAKVSSMNSAPEGLASKPAALDFSAGSTSASSPGVAAVNGGMMSTNHFAWGIGLGAVVVIGTVVGVTVAAATQSQASFAH